MVQNSFNNDRKRAKNINNSFTHTNNPINTNNASFLENSGFFKENSFSLNNQQQSFNISKISQGINKENERSEMQLSYFQSQKTPLKSALKTPRENNNLSNQKILKTPNSKDKQIRFESR